jgi:hypothetical protein
MPLEFRQTGTVKVTAKWTDTQTLTDIAETAVINPSIALVDGTGDGMANRLWQFAGTAAANSSQTLSLNQLAVSVYGGSGQLSMSAIKLAYFVNNGTVGLKFGSWTPFVSSDSASPAWLSVPSGSFVLAGSSQAGWATASDLTMVVQNATATGCAFSIVLVGVGA